MTVNLTERIHVTNEINDIDDATKPQESVKVLAGDDLKKCFASRVIRRVVVSI